jgi:hypothetical protein
MKTFYRRFVNKMSLLILIMFLPLFLWGYEEPICTEPSWRFWGSSMADCALSGGSQEVSHSHLPDLSNCVYYYKVQEYIFGFKVGDFAIVQVVRPCGDY